jgi:uncharacterized protein (TIGR00661 family)
MKNKTVLLAIQGEGRGHMTQAISVYNTLLELGFEVCCVVVGNNSRSIPEFLQQRIKSPVVPLPSPKFVLSGNRKVSMARTLLLNLANSGKYFHSARIFDRLVRFHRPDLIINFYEPLVPIYLAIYGFSGKVISIAHQYIYLHPLFEFPKGNSLRKFALSFYTRLTAFGSDSVLAISLYDLPDRSRGKLQVIPPLLRKELGELKVMQGNYILVYLVSSGYMDEIIQWHELNQDVRLHCFTDCPKVKTRFRGHWKFDDNLSFHSLDDRLFLDMMAGCLGLATTAGFESVCEANYLGKPVLMVPVEGHFEQYCNSVDAAQRGLGVSSMKFDPGKLIGYMAEPAIERTLFVTWVDTAENKLRQLISDVLQNEHLNGEISRRKQSLPAEKILPQALELS